MGEPARGDAVVGGPAGVVDHDNGTYSGLAAELPSDGGGTIPGRQQGGSSAGQASDGQEHPGHYQATRQGRRGGRPG